VVLADVGGEEFHVGDQAMLDANLALLAEHLPGAEVTVHGRGSALAELRDAASTADAVLLSGGGNLSSTWPHLLDQRIALLEGAAGRGVPVATGGQTIGPVIDEPRRGRLAAALATVKVLGVREGPSARLALDLGVPEDRLARQVDDAFWLEGAVPEDPGLRRVAADGFVSVTLDGSYAVAPARPGLQSLAAQVAVVAQRLGLPVLAIPHVGRLGGSEGGDAAAGRLFVSLAALAGARAHLVAVPTVAEAVWLHRRAALNVSSRYHPLVFGSAAGVPCLGISRDDYTAVKLCGALGQLGEERWVQSAAAAEAGGLLALATSVLGEWSAGAAGRDVALRSIAEAEKARRTRLVGALRGPSGEAGPGVLSRG
jgi:polysaccharide pyruvyl transferase WcaK-like protein